MKMQTRLREDSGAIAVVYAVVFVFVVVPLLVVGTTTYVRSSTTGELQRASDSGALAGAATIPFGNASFVLDYIDATSDGATTDTLNQLGLDYSSPDPLQVACDQAVRSATDPHNVAATYATAPSCQAEYLSDPTIVGAAKACAAALGVQAPPLPGQPDFSTLLPALFHPGVQTTMSWPVTGPMDKVLGGGTGKVETTTSIARRRFKDMVVVPVVAAPVNVTGGTADTQTINLNPYAGDVRGFVSGALDGTDQLLQQTPQLAPCAQAVDAARGDLLDAVDPPSTGPQFDQILSDALADQTPIVVVQVVEDLSVPYLDFVPVCVASVNGDYVGHPTTFGDCAVVAPGAFRASLRRQ
ncbi:MAG TPA: hypothetical protein VFH54_05020 [Mycobacteriales bacterium]|nr:hypothetical protein [Mycobacteriales bacterium]